MKFQSEMRKGIVQGVYHSKYPDMSYHGDDYFVTQGVSQLTVTTAGIEGDRHAGYETVSGGRFSTLYEPGTPVRNNRQWSAISPSELERISANLQLSQPLTPEILGLNFLIDGIENLSSLAPMIYLVFSPHQEFAARRAQDVALVVYGQALPCRIAGRAVAQERGDASLESRFPKASLGLRGTTGWVEKGGIICPGYAVWAMTPTGKD